MLDFIEARALFERVNVVAKDLRARLEPLAEHRNVGEIRGMDVG